MKIELGKKYLHEKTKRIVIPIAFNYSKKYVYLQDLELILIKELREVKEYKEKTLFN